MNIVILMGRLTRDPETRQTSNGGNMVTFTVAVDRPKRKDGTVTTDFPRCVAFGKTADGIAQYFRKGKPIMVQGRYQTDQYEVDGEKRTRSEVLVDRFEFVPTDTTERQAEPLPATGPATTDAAGPWDLDTDNLFF